MTWLRRNAVVLAGLLATGYLLLPNVVVLVFSFNDPQGRFNYEWHSFSTSAWREPCAVGEMCDSLALSLRLALLATLIATAFGTLAAFALARYRFRGKGAASALFILPMAMPEVVMAASLGTLFLNMRVEFGFTTILIAHVMFCLSFVIVTVKARLSGLDDNLEQAAMDLYATESQTFWRVTFPLVLPGIVSAALLSFSLSFDDFIITNFNSGSTITFPLYVYGAARVGVPPQVNVMGTIIFLTAAGLMLANVIFQNRSTTKGAVT